MAIKPTLKEEALHYHSKGRPGKIEVIPTKETATQKDLTLAYSPGVAEPCLAIEANPEDAYKYTAKGNLVAVISNGTAVLGLGDIGKHFPDTDQSFKNIDSKILLQQSYQLIAERGYKVVNVDSTILLQAPKIMKFVPAMQEAISKILELELTDVSIKATTTEQLSFIGREEGIVATANVLLCKTNI